MQRFAGYDPNSPTLIGPERSQGDCLGPDWPGGRTLVWWDSAAPIYSGDVCVIAMAPPNHPIQLAAKVLQATRAGRWFGICSSGPLPLDRLYVIGVAKIVAREVLSVVSWREHVDQQDISALVAELSGDAISEWQQLGYPPPTRFPGLRIDAETQSDLWDIVRNHAAQARSVFVSQAGHA